MAPFYHTQIQTTRKSQSAKIDEIVHETATAALRAAIWPRSAQEWANEGPGKGPPRSVNIGLRQKCPAENDAANKPQILRLNSCKQTEKHYLCEKDT